VAVREGLLKQPLLLSLLPLLLYSALYNISGVRIFRKNTDHPFAVIGIGSVIKVKPLPATQRENIKKNVDVVAVLAYEVKGGGAKNYNKKALSSFLF
jgi:hypothetical protein